MANPSKYTPSYDFSDFQAQNPESPLPGAQVDIQLQGIQQTTTETIDALADIRRSDGKLVNEIVTEDSLNPDLKVSFAGVAENAARAETAANNAKSSETAALDYSIIARNAAAAAGAGFDPDKDFYVNNQWAVGRSYQEILEILVETDPITYGADPFDSAHDDRAAIQRAIDVAQTIGQGSSGFPDVPLRHGPAWRINDSIELKSASLIGQAQANSGIRLIWGGASGGIALVFDDGGYPGSFAFKRLAYVNFRPGDNEPESWLKVSNTSPDVFGNLDHLHFLGGLGYQVDLAQHYVNCHWRNLRFDRWNKAAIRIIPSFLSSFSLDQFTADHQRETSEAFAFLHVDMSSMEVSNTGSIALRDARIEINQPMVADSALIRISHSGALGSDAAVAVLDGVSAQAVNDAAGITSVIHREGATTSSDSYILRSFRQSGLKSVRSGNWLSSEPEFPLVSSYSYLTNMVDRLRGLEIRSRTATDSSFRAFTGADEHPRIEIDQNGDLRFGSGAAATDIRIARSGADRLRVYDGLVVDDGVTTKTKAGTISDADFVQGTKSDGLLAVDTTNGRIYFRMGGVWRYVPHVRDGSTTYNPPSLADGARITTNVTVPGAAMGDIAMAAFSLDMQGVELVAQVASANTVAVTFINRTGGAVDLASGTLNARVFK